MQRFITFLSVMVLAVFLFQCKPQHPEVFIQIKNTSTFDRIDEGVTITRKRIADKLQETKDFQPAVYHKDELIPFQLDDLDGDGNWDELFFVIDVPANQTLDFNIRAIKEGSIPDFKARTNVRFADIKPPFKELTTAKRLSSTDTKISQKYFQMEGPAWENEYVAFRNYFDARNGIDIYGKRVHEMILHKVGINGQNYHELDDWGMDILSVGTSLGAGAIAMEIQDSVYRINYCENANVKVISKGPLRGIFELNFPAWQAAGRTYNIKHLITIPAGKRYYQSKVQIDGIRGDEKFVTGLVNIHNDTLFTLPNGKTTALATHAKQAYDSEYLGMALLINTADLSGTSMAPEAGDGIIQSHLIKLKISNNKPIVFRSYSCWEYENKKFKDYNYFIKFLKDEEAQMNAPLKVKILKD